MLCVKSNDGENEFLLCRIVAVSNSLQTPCHPETMVWRQQIRRFGRLFMPNGCKTAGVFTCQRKR